MITSYIVTMHTKVPYSAVLRSFFFTVYSIETIFSQPAIVNGLIIRKMSRTCTRKRCSLDALPWPRIIFAGSCLQIMAESTNLVAKALNRLTDNVFIDALTDHDRGSLSDLVQEYFCGAPDTSDADDDSGK